MKKTLVFVCLMIHMISVALAQPGSDINDYRHIYLPDPTTYLSGFLPNGALKLTVPQAQQLQDQIDMSNKGKVSDIRFVDEPNSKMYRIGNNLLSIFIYNDSLRWAIEQAIMPTLPEDPAGGDPMVVVDPPKYKPDIPVTNVKELESFVYYTAGAHYPEISSKYHSRLVSNSSIDLMLYYKTSLNFVQILGYDKTYRNQLNISIDFKSTNRQEAVNQINWIADNIAFAMEPPEFF